MQQLASEPTGYRLNSEQHLHISWRAILAGILVALAVDVLLSLLGFAVGLTAFEPTARRGEGRGDRHWNLAHHHRHRVSIRGRVLRCACGRRSVEG